MSDQGIKIICDNRKAFHNYHFDEKVEAGLCLKGTEVKSLRAGKANIKDAYAIFKSDEIYLVNAHINPYDFGNRENHDPLRSRKLLLHRHEIDKLYGKIEQKKLNLIPIKLYFKNGRVKVELGLGKSKKAFDKREATKERENKREMDRALKSKQRSR